MILGDCPSAAKCNEGRSYGLAVRIRCEEDLRRFPPIPRATKEFERRYKGRTSVERVNGRLKIFWGADDGNPTKNYSRGAYFFDEGGSRDVLKLSSIEQPGPDVLRASSGLASIRYQFGPDTMTWTVKNTTDHLMRFFIPFAPEVGAVRGGQDEWAKTPAERRWQVTTWFAGRSKLTITGGTRVWGPWAGQYQMWEAALGPGEERQIKLEVGTATDAEAARVASMTFR